MAKFIISKSKAKKQVDILKEIFDDISYSWKTNPTVGKILFKYKNIKFSITSINELNQFKDSLNPKLEEISKYVWYFTFAINNKDLDYLIKENKIKNFVIENETDLEVLINYIEKEKIKINLLLRMKLRENTVFTGKHYIFGMKVKVIREWIDKLENNKFIENIGIHFHRKTQNVSEWNLKREIEHSLGEEYIKKIDIINLGGGLPGDYKNIHDKAIESIFMKINELKDYLQSINNDLILYIEPGRFIAAPSVNLETNIIAINNKTCFLDVSIFNGALDTVVANIKLKVKDELEKGERYMLKGCTPDSTDILRYSVYLENPKVGDKIIFLNCGAYTYQTNFCALNKTEEEIID
jgi:ornithine decarboxylase